MSDYVRFALPALYVVYVGVGVVAWLVIAISLVQLPFNTKPDSINGRLGTNRYNVIFATDQLTARGIAIRRRLFMAVGVFVAMVVTGVAIAAIGKLLASSP